MAKRTDGGPSRFAPTLRGPGTAAVADRGPAPLLEIPENAAALAAVRALAETVSLNEEASPGDMNEERPEAAPAPGSRLYLYGPAGCGKTRLIDEFLRLDRSTGALRTAAERKASGVVRFTGAGLAAALDEALAGGFPGPLREDLLSARLLIVEDLAGVRAKPKTQDLLIAALDAVHQTGGRAILSGPGLPGELPTVSRRLIDRLRGGVCVSLTTPCAESVAALLERFAEPRRSRATPGGLRRLGEALAGTSVRELEAIADRLADLARAAGTTGWSEEIAAALLAGRHDAAPEAPPPTLAAVSRAVAGRFGLTVDQLRKPGRSAAVVPARQAGMALCREITGEPLAAVARHFGRSDHGTVMHALKRFAEREKSDAAFRAEVAAIRKAFRTR
ncbi:helix-turn-helix domain-containing protein [Alienimonas californiensis]|uniref:Chromosomal replication initiator protein DnaA n=1 Tax=Alienimonas californiensis TaxID=2527989 RepID=A0A517P3I4_9PLAN|nr:helix-turn-helix domain-containing protein [Alienimonas californiensis]QDT13933.1 Chromosomal replication initiator protein DnaA [Alienimonas californiensis]